MLHEAEDEGIFEAPVQLLGPPKKELRRSAIRASWTLLRPLEICPECGESTVKADGFMCYTIFKFSARLWCDNAVCDWSGSDLYHILEFYRYRRRLRLFNRQIQEAIDRAVADLWWHEHSQMISLGSALKKGKVEPDDF